MVEWTFAEKVITRIDSEGEEIDGGKRYKDQEKANRIEKIDTIENETNSFDTPFLSVAPQAKITQIDTDQANACQKIQKTTINGHGHVNGPSQVTPKKKNNKYLN